MRAYRAPWWPSPKGARGAAAPRATRPSRRLKLSRLAAWMGKGIMSSGMGGSQPTRSFHVVVPPLSI
jgi:hypothetical protein